MIPEFPEQTQLTLALAPFFSEFGSTTARYSTHSAANLVAWDLAGSGRVSKLGDNLVVDLDAYGESLPAATLILGDTDLAATYRKVLPCDGRAAVSYVPAESAHELELAGLQIDEDRDSSDYIYRVDELAELEGPGYHGLRRRRNRFVRDYAGEFTYVHDQHGTSSVDRLVNGVRDLAAEWGLSRYGSTVYDEALALSRMLISWRKRPLWESAGSGSGMNSSRSRFTR